MDAAKPARVWIMDRPKYGEAKEVGEQEKPKEKSGGSSPTASSDGPEALGADPFERSASSASSNSGATGNAGGRAMGFDMDGSGFVLHFGNAYELRAALEFKPLSVKARAMDSVQPQSPTKAAAPASTFFPFARSQSFSVGKQQEHVAVVVDVLLHEGAGFTWALEGENFSTSTARLARLVVRVPPPAMADPLQDSPKSDGKEQNGQGQGKTSLADGGSKKLVPGKGVVVGKVASVIVAEDRSVEHPSFNWQKSGSPYRYLYCCGDAKLGRNAPFQVILKYDMGQFFHDLPDPPIPSVAWTFDAGPRMFVSQPVFVPKVAAGGGGSTGSSSRNLWGWVGSLTGQGDGREDEGWVMGLVYEGAKQKTFLLVLDAKSGSVVCRLYFKHHVPFGSHCSFSTDVNLPEK
eukprot:TRINITY_DN11793_c0_g1_i2.p1 TRINITY_DN11793_c0_g1~~TRINITY_DN11793_c0_g1_i2.p1  ORF type:complete len:472 (-),score=104.81 TRINITY_DN11793_c0_g1_i2:576-1790(-)